MPQPEKLSKGTLIGGLFDFLILCLLVGGAGFGGYYLGIHERLAPVELVPAGTPGARDAGAEKNSAHRIEKSMSQMNGEDSALSSSKVMSGPASLVRPKKYWITSSGMDYIGYSVVVSVNGHPIDVFFGPGKEIDLTKSLHKGGNDITFQAKALGDRFNLHKGDAKSSLVLNVVSGPAVGENFDTKDVLISYQCNAAQTERIGEKHILLVD